MCLKDLIFLTKKWEGKKNWKKLKALNSNETNENNRYRGATLHGGRGGSLQSLHNRCDSVRNLRVYSLHNMYPQVSTYCGLHNMCESI